MLKYPTYRIKGGARVSPEGNTMWCGPFALAVLTGVEYEEAHRWMVADARRVHRALKLAEAEAEYRAANAAELREGAPDEVDWTYPHQMERILTSKGVKTRFTNIPEGKRPTLQSFVRNHTAKGKAYLIGVGAHWLVTMNGIVYQSLHKPCHVSEAPRYRTGRVDMWASVRPKKEALTISED
jgi:hypothetical protein